MTDQQLINHLLGMTGTIGNHIDTHGALRYVVTAYKDEPLVVLRGRDALVVPVLTSYIKQCDEHGLEGQSNRMYRHLVRFQEWQRDYAKLTHLPDPLPSEDASYGTGSNSNECDNPRCYCHEVQG